MTKEQMITHLRKLRRLVEDVNRAIAEIPYLPHTTLKASKKGLQKEIDKFEEHLHLGEYDEANARANEYDEVIKI